MSGFGLSMGLAARFQAVSAILRGKTAFRIGNVLIFGSE
jgi:hypothetical protein